MMGISLQEYSRRHAAIREQMRRDGLDSLLIAGLSDDFNRGNIRYITGSGRGGYCILPLEGDPDYFSSSLLARSSKFPKTVEAHPLLQIRVTNEPVAQAVKELLSCDGGNAVGVVGMNCVPASMYLGVKKTFGERVRDVSEYLRPFREIKSEEEIEKLRVAAGVADKVYTRLREIVRPGLDEFAIYGEVKKVIYGEGCEYSFEVLDAAGAMMNMAFFPTRDALEANGTLFIEISPAYQGYYAQLPVTLPVQKYPDHIKRMARAWSRADAAARTLLRPGTRVSDLYHQLINSIREAGFVSPLRPGHSVGLDILDFWSIDAGNTAVLKAGMCIAVHPCCTVDLGSDGVGMGYTYLINDSGAEKLNKVDLTADLLGES
jgi:Xaa-Pro aminopeptidase